MKLGIPVFIDSGLVVMPAFAPDKPNGVAMTDERARHVIGEAIHFGISRALRGNPMVAPDGIDVFLAEYLENALT